MAKINKKSNSVDLNYMKLAYEQASINLGSTSTNPSVGCVVVKNNSVISSGYTSLNGRPHAENNALKKKIDYRNSDIYVTLEPCSHHGKTPPCTDNIISKEIKRVIFPINDIDKRSKNKAEKKLKKKKINIRKFLLKNFAKDFYRSYFLQSSKKLPYVDAKLAISKDFFTINKKNKWITNIKSRRLGNYLRSKYDCLLTTAKTVNDDNPLLDCRIEGLEKKTPDLVIIDRSFSVKKNSKIFEKNNRQIYIFTTSYNKPKESLLKKKGVKIIKLFENGDIISDLRDVLYDLKKLGFSRILVESGITFLSQMLQHNMIENFYLFKSFEKLNLKGLNNCNPLFIKKIKTNKGNRIEVNLDEDNLYKVKL
jgi:diaminohydroxyphosphoribosylaminopyrimidine deaminase/5-amino-6-(5-phosphoribosylamino)uracil reductase